MGIITQFPANLLSQLRRKHLAEQQQGVAQGMPGMGMGAMMGAVLQAPLAALMAVMELTHNPNIILPGMLALIAGVLVSREVFDKESVYVVLIKARGLDYRATPMTRAPRRVTCWRR